MEVKHATPNFETRILNSVLSAPLSDYDIDLIMILVDDEKMKIFVLY